jgi:FkbM family methyltransferase
MTTTIPKTIHQIWLGGPMPQRFAEYAQRWKELHPQWTYRLWQEEDLTWLDHSNEFASVPQYATKANIARYEIVARYGGVYLDADMEPIKSIDSLIEGTSMVVCPERPGLLNNAFFAAAPNHPILLHVLSELRESIDVNRTRSSPEMCGPVFFTRAVQTAIAVTGADCRWLERHYFYPYNWDQSELERMPSYPGSYAIHRWDNSWVAPLPSLTLRRRLIQEMCRLTKTAARRCLHALERLRKPQGRVLIIGHRALVDVEGRFALLVPADDLNLLPELFMHGVSARPYLYFIDRFLRPSDHVVDIGANIGYTALAAACALGRYGRVDAFETDSAALDLLEDNIYMNRRLGVETDIRIHSCSVGISAERLVLTTRRTARGRPSLNRAVNAKLSGEQSACGEIEVKVRPLAEVLGNVTKIRLANVHAQGSEDRILESLIPLIESQRIDCASFALSGMQAGGASVRFERLVREMTSLSKATCHKLKDDGTLEPLTVATVFQGPALAHLVLRFDECGPTDHSGAKS